jgi:hypothetical protein
MTATSTMTAEQRNYFLDRLDEITAEKLQAKAVELFGATGRPEQPTWGTVFEAIRAGEITLKEGTEDCTRAYLNPIDVVWPAMDAKREAMDAYRKQLAVEKQKAVDSVMLDGTAQTALADYAKV